MRFKKLTQSDKDYIKIVYENKNDSWGNRMLNLVNHFEISERQIRRWIKWLGYSNQHHQEEKESEDYIRATQRKLVKKQHYLFTWAQNATPIHQKMWENMKDYAKYLNADIHVIAGRYRNPTSVFTDKKHDTWEKQLIPYLDANRHKIHSELTILSDLKIHPTAIYPLSGLEGLSKGGSIIVGSPKIHLQSFPVLKGDSCKFAASTGAITKPNYTDSKSGKRGEFFHMYGFLIVEIEGNEFYFRQVPVCDDGSFIDLDLEVKNKKITKIEKLEAVILGDVHQSEMDHKIEETTFRFLDNFKVNKTIVHDIFNGKSINHHDKNNPVLLYQKYINGEDDLSIEIESMLDWIDSRKDYNLMIVSSNHNDWIDRWVNSEDWRKDIKNSLWYSKLLTASLEGKASKGLIAYLIEQRFKNKVTCLDRDDSYKVGGYELAYHGDQGQNGSKGNLKQFARLNTKVVVGDYHSCGRIDGAIGVGTMTPLKLGYNKGASSWNNAHAIIHTNGKVQHLFFKQNKRFSKRYK